MYFFSFLLTHAVKKHICNSEFYSWDAAKHYGWPLYKVKSLSCYVEGPDASSEP